MNAYEAPKMTFEKLELFEKIACDHCWDSKKIKFDIAGDKYCPICIELDDPVECANVPCNEGNPLFAARLWVADYFNIYTVRGLRAYTKWLRNYGSSDFPATKVPGFDILIS